MTLLQHAIKHLGYIIEAPGKWGAFAIVLLALGLIVMLPSKYSAYDKPLSVSLGIGIIVATYIMMRVVHRLYSKGGRHGK